MMTKSICAYTTVGILLLGLVACNDSTSGSTEEGDSSSLMVSSSEKDGNSSALNASSEDEGFSSEGVSSPRNSSAKSSSSQQTNPSSSSTWAPTSFDWDFCTTEGKCGTFTDSRETPAKSYKWVKIGNDTWMAENLAYLPKVSRPSDTSTANAKYYVYNYDGTDPAEAKKSANYNKYGVLYNFQAALTACPTGWIFPTDSIWMDLMDTVDLNDDLMDNQSEGTSLRTEKIWTDESSMYIQGTNLFGFSALPAGKLNGTTFTSIGSDAYWFTATEQPHDGYHDIYNYGRNTNFFNDALFSVDLIEARAYSVRCVKERN